VKLTQTSDLWWKNAVVYCLDVETYADGDGDGCGDFRGLIQRLDHLHRLGVTCIWLMPFYPSPDRDDGYDITDFCGVDPRLGTLGDFVEFVRTARDRGMRVIADLVVNHTSAEHPWFRSARSSPDSPYRDWYVWQDEPPADGPQGVTFPDQETSLWEYDEEAGQYFLHRFYKHQPDLNVANPAVRDEIARVMGFWMQLGLSGFRVDAVPFLLETAGQDDAAELPDPHGYLADLRAFLSRRNGEAVLLGEVNLPYADTLAFFGEGDDELTMCFDFVGMQQMYLALARGDAGPLADALRTRPEPPKDAHWATFVRTTTSSPSTSCRRPSARRSSTRSARTRTCSSTAAACAGGCRRCSTATRTASGWCTACCTPSPALPCCSTARRSGWARTSPSPAGSRCAPRCSGRRTREPGSPPRTPRRSPPRCPTVPSHRSGSTRATRPTTPAPCCRGSSAW
jgi:hypothetical protein